MSSAITIQKLGVDVDGKAILQGINLTLPIGRVIGLLGPSGAGKTTLMRAIVGRQKLSAGKLEVLGLPAGAPALRARIGYVTQAPSVYKDLTVQENLRYFANLSNAPRSRVAEVIGEVGLQGHEHQLADSLSGGQLSRVSLAAALMGHPELLVLDEPTVGIDPLLRRDLWQHFRKLAAAGTTLLVSSHVMDEAAHCDELLLLRDGQVLAYGTQPELLEQTGAHDVEGVFLALVEDRA